MHFKRSKHPHRLNRDQSDSQESNHWLTLVPLHVFLTLSRSNRHPKQGATSATILMFTVAHSRDGGPSCRMNELMNE